MVLPSKAILVNTIILNGIHRKLQFLNALCKIEYCENYKKYDPNAITRGKSAAPVQVPLAGGQFLASTESREQYTIHKIPTRVSAKKPEVVLQGGSFESATTQKLDYPPWSGVGKVASSKPPQVWMGNTSTFYGVTTNKSDYKPLTIPPRFQRKQAEYIRSDASFESKSVQAQDYKAWKLPPKHQLPKAIYVYNDIPTEGKSEYSNSFQPKKTAKYVHVMPPHIPNDAKFEATSTHKTDFAPFGKVKKSDDFRPRNKYIPIEDNRDFITTNRGQLDIKKLPPCPAVSWLKVNREIHSDGHVYLAKAEKVWESFRKE